MGDLPQAVAEPIARHKDETKSWITFCCYKKRYTIPSSLTTALISTLGALTELLASIFKFNPDMKHYCAPFAEHAEFGAHPYAFCSSGRAAAAVTRSPSDAEGPLLGSRIWQHPGEPVIVTPLLPHCPSTSSLITPSNLHLTTVQHILVGSCIEARPSSKLVALGPFSLARTSSWWAIRKTVETESGFSCLTKTKRLIKSMTMMSMQ